MTATITDNKPYSKQTRYTSFRVVKAENDRDWHLKLNVSQRKGYPIGFNGYSREIWKVRKAHVTNDYNGGPQQWVIKREFQSSQDNIDARYLDWENGRRHVALLPNFEIELIDVQFVSTEKKEKLYNSLSEEIHDIIKSRDDDEGEGWSDDTQELVKLVADFTTSKLDEIAATIIKGTRNRQYFKAWERKVMELLGE